jgi:hypothetical protein
MSIRSSQKISDVHAVDFIDYKEPVVLGVARRLFIKRMESTIFHLEARIVRATTHGKIFAIMDLMKLKTQMRSDVFTPSGATAFRTLYYRCSISLGCGMLELDYTGSAKCRLGISHHSMDNQAPKWVHLTSVYLKVGVFVFSSIPSKSK